MTIESKPSGRTLGGSAILPVPAESAGQHLPQPQHLNQVDGCERPDDAPPIRSSAGQGPMYQAVRLSRSPLSRLTSPNSRQLIPPPLPQKMFDMLPNDVVGKVLAHLGAQRLCELSGQIHAPSDEVVMLDAWKIIFDQQAIAFRRQDFSTAVSAASFFNRAIQKRHDINNQIEALRPQPHEQLKQTTVAPALVAIAAAITQPPNHIISLDLRGFYGLRSEVLEKLITAASQLKTLRSSLFIESFEFKAISPLLGSLTHLAVESNAGPVDKKLQKFLPNLRSLEVLFNLRSPGKSSAMLSVVLQALPGLSHIAWQSDDLAHIPDELLRHPALRSVELRIRRGKDFDLSCFAGTNIQKIKICGATFSKLDLMDFKKLERLQLIDLSECQASSVVTLPSSLQDMVRHGRLVMPGRFVS